jgi:hypothetical protein
MADGLSRAVGRTISFVHVPPETMRGALDGLGFPAWQADGLLEEFDMYRRGEAAGIESGVTEALGRRPHFSPNEKKTGRLFGALRRPGEFRFEADLGSVLVTLPGITDRDARRSIGSSVRRLACKLVCT